MKNLKIIKKYFQVTKANKKTLFLLVLTSFLTNAPYLFTSLLFSLTVNFLTKKDTYMVVITMCIYFVLKIFSKLLRVMSYSIEKKFYNDVYYQLHHQMICKLDIIDMKFFNQHSQSEILNIVNGDIKLLADFGSWLSQAIFLFLSFLVSIAILSRISIGLMIFGCIINGIVIFVLNIYNDKFEILTREGKIKADDEMHFYHEMLSGLRDIKIFQLLDNLHIRYQSLNQAYIHVHNKQINNKMISDIISPTITMCTEIILMIYACYYCLYGRFEIDTVLIIQSYFGALFSSLSQFVSTLGELRIKNVSIDRYDQFIHSHQNEHFIYQEIIPFNHYEIQLKDIYFSYNDKPVFNGLNVHIQPCTLNAIIGESGSGKSTLFNLLLRFEKVDSGHIFIGNYPIEQIPKKQYSQIISCVSQQPYLFHMSIYENFALINSDINEIRKACQKAEIDDFIMSLPNQYDTILDEGAINLSGGQKQRIAIARAILKNSKILLCDEMTSALDEKTTLGIFDTLKKLKKEHTIIIISHKPIEYQQCENIINLQNYIS